MLPNHQRYPNVIPLNTQDDAIGIPVLAAPFKTQQFTTQMFMAITIDALDDPDVPFEVGETITGGTSAATGIVIAFDGTVNLVVMPISGTFQTAEEITGGTSGAEGDTTVVATPDFDIQVISSNQELPPDPSLPLAADNQYSYVGFTDQSDAAYYTSYNPKDMTPDFVGEKCFNIETSGGRWVFIQISSYIGGSLYSTNVDLFNNIV